MAYDGVIDVITPNERNLHGRLANSKNPVLYYNRTAGFWYIKSTDNVHTSAGVADETNVPFALAFARPQLNPDGTDIP